MKFEEISHYRLYTQHLSNPTFKTPTEVVRWFGAVQSQDYTGAKWAVGQRMKSASDEVLDEAFNSGKILRTHVMRPTWHFVTPEDIRWLLALTAPRVHAISAYYYRKSGLDADLFRRTNEVFRTSLQGGKFLTRDELAQALENAGIPPGDGLRLGYIVIQAELEAVICSGPKRDKQFTYALLDERAPNAKVLSREESLAELSLRFISGHGWVQVKDFSWWSGLSVTDSKKGFEMVKSKCSRETIEGKEYWFVEGPAVKPEPSPKVYLLSNYDEYYIGYADRSASAASEEDMKKLDWKNRTLYLHAIVLDGLVVGMWKRTFTKKEVVMDLQLVRKLTDGEMGALELAAEEYGKFTGLTAKVGKIDLL